MIGQIKMGMTVIYISSNGRDRYPAIVTKVHDGTTNIDAICLIGNNPPRPVSNVPHGETSTGRNGSWIEI